MTAFELGPAGVAALSLAAVLVAAAVAKLRDPSATSANLAELGLVAPAVLAWLVPVVELGLAVLLVARPAWGGLGAFALLAAFTAVLIQVLRSGRVVSCRCFGALSDRPVSMLTLARNAALGALAAIAGFWPTI